MPGFAPAQVLASFRRLNPGKFDEFEDADLLDSIQRLDPETFKLVDPLLIGSEILGGAGTPPPDPPKTLRTGKPADPTKPYPLPTPAAQPTWADTAVTTSLRVGGGLVGGGATALATKNPRLALAGGSAGMMAGDAAAQQYEIAMGLRDAYSPAETAIQGGLGLVPMGEVAGIGGLGARTAIRAGQGALLGRAGGLAEELVTGEHPTGAQVATQYGAGGVMGGLLHGAVEAAEQLAAAFKTRHATQRASGQKGDVHSALEDKRDFETLVELQQPPPPPGPPPNPQLVESMLRTGARSIELPTASPYPPPPPRPQALPPGRFIANEAGDVAAPGQAGELPGQGFRPIRAAEPPPTLQDTITQATAGTEDVGPPRLVLKAESDVPRATPEQQLPLLRTPRRNLNAPLEQTGEMGGLPATAEQPRLPHVDRGVSVARTYPEGPNVGPRRSPREELHGVPRPVRRQVKTGDKIRYETPPSKLKAEDPGTYPPEVRRELARMLYEMETYRYERLPGGVTHAQIAEQQAHGDMTYGRATGASAGGAIGGAPVYHDILEMAGGPKGHATRESVLRDLRAAVLEGKGSHVSDAAALVARERMAQEGLSPAERKYQRTTHTKTAGGSPLKTPIPKFSTRSEVGAGDHLIGWEDPAGRRALPDQDLSDHQRMARDAEDGDITAAARLYKSMGGRDGMDSPAQADAYEALLDEGVRRGLLTPEQLDLQMGAVGATGGPSLFDFDPEGPPRKPGLDTVVKAEAEQLRQRHLEQGMERRAAEGVPDNPRARGLEVERRLESIKARPPEDVPLPGLEGVRDIENPTPPVADAPFALEPPPAKPRTRGPKPETRPLFGTPEYTQWYQQLSPLEKVHERLTSEEGVLILKTPAGDRAGLKKWMKHHEDEHGGEAWYSRVEHYMEAGDWDKAWLAAQSASAHSFVKAYRNAQTPQEQKAIEQLAKGMALQSDMNTQLVSGARYRAGVGTAPEVPTPKGALADFPPSLKVSQAGAARGKATLGPAGVLNPGAPKRPLSSAAPALRGATLDREVVRLIIDATDAEGMSTVPGNRDTFLRVYRQMGEQVYQGSNLKLLREAGVSIPPEELAQHFNQTVSDWGRGLQMIQQFAQTNKTTLEEAAEAMSMGGALRGMLKPGEAPPPFVGAGGRQISEPGARATVDALAQDTQFYEQAAMANSLQKRAPVGPLRALHDASYAFMLSKWNTAVRNYASFTGRYSVDTFDHALTIPLAQLGGDTQTAAYARGQVQERGFTPLRQGTSVSPRRAWGDTLQEIHNFTIDRLNELPPADARRSISLLLNQPEHLAEYLGTMTGEDLSAGFSNTPVLRHLTNPKVQRVLTMFNRAQEFSARATVFDSTMRALLRAEGHEPTALLQRPFSEIQQTVGGAAKMDDLLFTATSQALEATFAGRVSKDSLPGALIRFMNTAWPAKLAFPFPKFNLSAAPRWLFDHSPAALFDLVRFPLDAAGLTAPAGTMAGGRLYRGVRAQTIQRKGLPGLALQIGSAERRQGTALGELLATQREMQIRARQVTRLEGRTQAGLPEVQTQLQAAIDARDQLRSRREALKGQMQEARRTVGDLKSEQKKLLSVLQDAQGINAPNFAQYLARIGTGTVGMLGAAWVVRAQAGAEGARWYEYRVEREGKDPVVLDFRPFAPFAQYLFVADVLHDFDKHTNWANYHEEMGDEYSVAHPLDAARALWNNYEGKYTGEELGSQFAQAFLSISRAAGTTLTLTDLLTKNGWPGPQDAADAIVGTIGQFLSRFTVPLSQGRDLAGQLDPEEAKTRTPPRATLENWERPLAAPIANVPYASQVIPETLSQTTGKPIASEYPWLRGIAGVGATPRDFVTEEVRRVGVPGQSVYIRETGDVGLDRMVAESYSRLLKEYLPQALEHPQYQALGTPARQRDFLTQYVFPPIKQAALAEARQGMGEASYEAATVKGEAARRKARQARLLDQLIAETPTVPEEEADPDAPPGPPDPMVGAPPPPGP